MVEGVGYRCSRRQCVWGHQAAAVGATAQSPSRSPTFSGAAHAPWGPAAPPRSGEPTPLRSTGGITSRVWRTSLQTDAGAGRASYRLSDRAPRPRSCSAGRYDMFRRHPHHHVVLGTSLVILATLVP